MRATVVIPAYNEQDTIERTVSAIRDLGQEYNVLVVDDGSADRTAALAEKAGAEVVSHPYNKGYGAALKTGIENAASDTVILFDADGQHDADSIPAMVEMMRTFDMVIGDRSKSDKTHMHRMPGKWLLGKVANILAGHTIPDLNCGFRCLKRERAKEFFYILPNGFSFSTTITLAFYKEGLNVGFIPISTRKRTRGKSEVRLIKDGAKTLLLIARITALFNPLKIFAPAGAALVVIGGVYGLYYVVTEFNIPDGAVLAILFGIILVFFGIFADLITSIKRQIR